MPDLIGWSSSLLLVVTIAVQIRKQWHERTSQGVSRWLYVGQIAASLGFTVYSWLLGTWVFILTNALLTLMAVSGLVITAICGQTGRRARTLDPTRNVAVEAGCLDPKAGT